LKLAAFISLDTALAGDAKLRNVEPDLYLFANVKCRGKTRGIDKANAKSLHVMVLENCGFAQLALQPFVIFCILYCIVIHTFIDICIHLPKSVDIPSNINWYYM